MEVEENTNLSFRRKKDKRSSDKFALDELITVFLAARMAEGKSSERRFKVHFVCFLYKTERGKVDIERILSGRGGMFYSGFLRGNFINLRGYKLTQMTSCISLR